jgi:hypothetical protein
LIEQPARGWRNPRDHFDKILVLGNRVPVEDSAVMHHQVPEAAEPIDALMSIVAGGARRRVWKRALNAELPYVVLVAGGEPVDPEAKREAGHYVVPAEEYPTVQLLSSYECIEFLLLLLRQKGVYRGLAIPAAPVTAL